MKKFGIFAMGLAMAAFAFTSCGGEKNKPVDVVEDGFYVVGEATAIPNLTDANAPKGLMAAGTNEVTKTKRAGMYEKYIALEANKDFELILREGTTEVHYGAKLALSDTLEGDNVPQIQVYQGVMAENTKMQVPESNLYHIILDLNQEGDLKDKLIMVVPVEWGVRGAMNSWGYSAMKASEFNKTSMTYVIEDQLVKEAGQFKFAHSNGWKFELDDAGLVKAENNLGCDAAEDGGEYTSLLPGGKNLPIGLGYWKLELKWSLEGGALEKSFTYTPTKTKDYSIDPTALVLSLIGSAINNDTNWGTDADFKYVGESNGVYTYAIENQKLNAGEFKVRFDHAWNSSYGYGDLTIEGDKDNFKDKNGNIEILAEKTYKKISFQFTLENKVAFKNQKLVFEL
jgi:hypothetical protein